MNRSSIAGLLLLGLAASGCAPPKADEDRRPGGGKSDDLGESGEDRAARVVAAISAWNSWVPEEDRRAKYCKMASSPFVFFRGTNHLYWADFAGDPRLDRFGSERTRTWLQGDLHAENFGAFDNDRGVVVYSLDDFDDSVIADYQLDLWRMAVSIALIAQQHAVISTAAQGEVIDAFIDAYLEAMSGYRGNDDELDATFTAASTSGLVKQFLEEVETRRSRERALDRWTVLSGETRTFDLSRPELAPVSARLDDEIRAAQPGYMSSLSGGGTRLGADYLAIKSVARRLGAGTGSLGSPRYYLLIEGPSASPHDDRILDVKRQDAPTPYHFFTAAERADYDRSFAHHAERHARGYKALERHTDDHLGWMILGGDAYSVRERSVFKATFATETLSRKREYRELAAAWGTILATGHARADKDFDAQLVPFSVDKQIDEATSGARDQVRALAREIAFSYATQVERDWEAFVDALAPADCDGVSTD
jgi:uncharacterized protein (DUF2252 family)